MNRRRAVAVWLFGLAAMVFAMVVLGGLTRLTGSGLSMVEWKPVTGWLPPLGEADWQAVFARYRGTPEFEVVNRDMTLDGFKSIFWLEYLHRLWGRLMGVVFAVPFVVFLAAGWLNRRLVLRLLGVFVLGGLQGVLGWTMVKSGLVDVPEVDQYRLVAHLGLALVILAWLLWMALGQWFTETDPYAPDRLRRFARMPAVVVLVTVLSGGFVAGLDAGLAYNTFPTMDGEWVPSGLLAMDPVYVNPFENLITAQFDHRVMAALVVLAVAAFWVSGLFSHVAGRTRVAMNVLAAAVAVQVSLGIGTLLLLVPISLAALHQAGAVVLFAAALWVAFELRRPPDTLEASP